MKPLPILAPDLPIGSTGTEAVGWWGIICGIITEGALFAYLLFSYYYFAVQPREIAWPPEMPTLTLALPNTGILIASSIAAWWGERGAKKGDRKQQAVGLGLASLLGIIFIIIQLFEWRSKTFGLHTTYGSLFYTVTGFHMAHVVVGVLILIPLTVWAALGYFDPKRHAPISIGAIYWHFVDVVWLTVFFTFYLTPYLGLRNG